MEDRLYARIYLRTDRPGTEIRGVIARAFGGRIDAGTVIVDGLVIATSQSRFGKIDAPRPDCVEWPISLEVEPEAGMGMDGFVTSVSRILDQAKAAAIEAVVSCDFEERFAPDFRLNG